MATQSGTTEHPLEQLLSANGRRFSFFQIVQLMERCFHPASRVGRLGPVSDELIRFRPSASLAFPASDIAGVEQLQEGEENPARFRVTTTFMGLYGSTSPLPSFYAEEILWKEENDTVREFIDIFHHRLLSLFYRCWFKYRYHMQFEPEGRDEFSRRMFGLIGLGSAGLTENTGVPSVRLIRYAGLLSQQTRPARTLEGMLSDYFEDINIRVEPFTGRWVPIAPEQHNALGLRFCSLAEDCNIGERVYSRSSSFRIAAGPLKFDIFVTFLPERENNKILISLVNFFIRDRLEFDIKLSIIERDIPQLRLFSDDQAGRMQLGWTTWLFSERSESRQERYLVLKGSC